MAERASYSLGETLLEDECMTLCRARRTADHQAVVLKLMDPRRCQQRDAERLRREHAFAATLVPTAILKPLGLETFQGMLALVFEDFEGRPLEQLLGAPMQVERFLELAVGIARALAALHRQGVIHKDLKPANIFVHSTSREVRLAGLGFATRLPREPQALQPPLLIEGSLPYMSPEQTGHMSRALDSRSDLYSLGVVLYQTLTGRLPFAAHDALEWVHCHVARLPSSPRALAPELPETLNAMVMKLLSKTAEERYQSAGGLQQDLERCLQEWRATGTITRFTLGAHDTPDRLRLPQRLYGREAEIALLQRALAQVGDTGRSQLLLVSGFAGIGKSVLVQELHPPLVARRGLFASGKFDQLRRDAPYSTIVQAFTDLVRELLAGDEKQRTQWRERLQAALGANGRIITEVIAPVELLIGPQPPVPPLPPTETQNRFRMVFRRFIGVLARPGQPMTLFLDDLQWADSASLVLLEDLATHAEVRHLLLVGAYRDNEVSSAHPLLLALDRVRRTGAQVDEIVLGPLSRQDMTALVADALHCRREEAASLGDLIHRKTAGNPLFTGQFLSSLDAVELGAAVRRIGEVDPAVAPADDVVGTVELPAAVVGRERHDPAVGFRPRDLARRMLAGDEAALPVVRQAVGHVARLAERGDAVLRRPAAHVVAGHVAEQQEPARRVPHGALGEEEPRPELLELVAHFLTGCPGLPAAYQSAGGTSSNTTHTASRGSLQTSEIVSVTRRAISSLRCFPWPS
ncbi:MAG: AAA family ATPase [Deltaproteobacteria bacterium]|nr:AAA family ATPase [Deltaproteobacteria bacterium]